MLSPFGPGISWWITVLFVGTTSWTSASNARLTRLVRLVKSARWLGVSVIMPSISIVSVAGSRLVKFVLWITVSGSFRSMVIRTDDGCCRWFLHHLRSCFSNHLEGNLYLLCCIYVDYFSMFVTVVKFAVGINSCPL